MSSFLDRLRGAVHGGAPGAASRDYSSDPTRSESPAGIDGIADTLEGEWHGSNGQRYLVVDRKYGPGHRHGDVAICDAAPGTGGWPRLELLASGAGDRGRDERQGKLLFIDLETTGLAGGAGTCAFLVGCAWFDGAAFRIRQFFLSSVMSERALLEAVADLARDATAIGTYNGKSFDLPLLETRYAWHRLDTPFAQVPHVDMLHHARRLWHSRAEESGGCRLGDLERALCGHEREFDVPGFEIPSRYFHYVRSGDARPLQAVLEHNRLDLLSLALLTARAVQLLDDGAAQARTAREALGLGCLYERGGMKAQARAAFARAAGMDGISGLSADPATRAEALRAFALLARRQRQYDDAAIAWRGILDLGCCQESITREATDALAVHHEHRVRNLEMARRFALQSLQFSTSVSRTGAVHHRLARINRKLSSTPPASADLF